MAPVNDPRVKSVFADLPGANRNALFQGFGELTLQVAVTPSVSTKGSPRGSNNDRFRSLGLGR